MAPSDLKATLREVLPSLVSAGNDLGETVDMARSLAELIRPYAAPGFECIMAPLPPTPPVPYPGVDGIERAWRDFSEDFQSIHAELEEIVEGENSILILVRLTAVTGHGGVEMSHPGTMVIAIEGDQIANVQFHLDRETALRAGGLV